MHDTSPNQRESFNGADKITNATYGMMKAGMEMRIRNCSQLLSMTKLTATYHNHKGQLAGLLHPTATYTP